MAIASALATPDGDADPAAGGLKSWYNKREVFMTMAATKSPADLEQTVEDYLSLSDPRGWELVDGHLVEKNVGTHSSFVGSILLMLLGAFLKDHPIGWALHGDTAYRCFPDHPKQIRKPDVSFIRKARLSAEQLAQPFISIAPDLAVEVVSPNDTFMEVDRKVREYLAADVRLVWVVNPEMRTVRIHRANGTMEMIDENGRVSGEEVLPGFSFAVADLFPQPAAL